MPSPDRLIHALLHGAKLAQASDRPAQLSRPPDRPSSGYVSSSRREGSTFADARREYGGPAHTKLPGEPALGVWRDEAEESAHVSGPPADAERTTLIAGVRNGQKAVALFHPDPAGPDARHVVRFAGSHSPETLHAAGRAHGFAGATFIPRGSEIEAHYLDPGRAMGSQATRLAQAFGGKLTTEPGRVEFVGADSREEARKIFLDRLKAGRKKS